MPRPVLLSLCALLALVTLSGCGTTSTSGPGPAPSSQTTSDGERVSSIPWNKPQRWESGGQLGGVMGN
jgi:predicted small lipoprotein YifL